MDVLTRIALEVNRTDVLAEIAIGMGSVNNSFHLMNQMGNHDTSL